MGVASHFRSSSSERLCHAAQVQNVNFEKNHATDQIRGLVCHDRSQGCILSHIHPSMSQEVPEVHFWGQSIPVSGSSVRPSIITSHFHEMRRCSPGACSASVYSHYELHSAFRISLLSASGAALYSRRYGWLRSICAFIYFFYIFLLYIFTCITSALFIYDKRTLLDIGHHCTNLLQDTLSMDPACPLEILRNTEVNKGRLNNSRRRKKHRGRRPGIRNRLRKRAHSPSLPSILLTNVQYLENKLDDLRARISFQRDIRDCNILCLTETWLTPSVPDTAVASSDNFSVLRMDRTAEAGKTKGGGVCLMINKKWCDPRNISILSRSCSSHLEHLSIICRPFYLPREFTSIIVTAVYIPPEADTGLTLSKLHDELSGYINKHPDAACIIAGDFNKAKSCRTFNNIYPVQLEDRIH